MSGRGAPHEPAAGEFVVVPATLDRWEDVALLLGGTDEASCWCQAWRGTPAAYGLPRDTSRPDTLRWQLAEQVPTGFMAYVDGQPAGWCGVAVRTETPRLRTSRTIPAIDDAPVWSIGCFKIRVGYRRKGVARALLAAVIDAAREAGAPGVEAYPIDPAGARVDVGFAFVGLASMFDEAGFRRVLETDAHSASLPRLLVRLDIDGPSLGRGASRRVPALRRTSMGRRIALVALLVALAGCTGGPRIGASSGAPLTTPAAAAASPSPTPEPSSWPTIPPEETQPPLPDGVTGEIADAIHTRWQFGLRSDLAWVEAVAADPDDESMLEIPMTAEENREWKTWFQETDRLVEILGAYGRARPDEFGGIFVDQRGRQVATLWTDDLDGHEARLRERAGDQAAIVLYHVEHPESYLRQLQDLVPTDDPIYAEAAAEPFGIGVDIKRNAVSIDVSSANPEAPRLISEAIAARLSVPPDLVTVDSDGTGVMLLPFGQIEIHVVGPDGHRLPKGSSIDWRYEGEQIGSCGPGGDMWIAFDDRGMLRTSCNPGTWRIVITNLDRTRDLGHGTATIRANELTKIKITLDRNP